jgi:SulP family sulfate permease
MWNRIVLDALVLGVLGCIDSLLTAMIADSLPREYHDSDRELMGQGIGNLVSGLFGGLPGAGATMGTVVNIQTGAKTNLSGIIRALLLFTLLLGAAPLVGPIPMAVLAAIALKVGVDILDWSFMQRVHQFSRSSTFMMYGVMLLTVFVDLIVAVALGVFIANILTIERLSAHQESQVKAINDADDDLPLSEVEQRLLEAARGRVLLFYLSGPLIFGVSKAIARQHAAINDCQVVVFDLNNVPLIDVTVSLAIENAIKDAVYAGKQVLIVSSRSQVQSRLERLGIFSLLPRDALMQDRTEALTRACDLAQSEARDGSLQATEPALA